MLRYLKSVCVFISPSIAHLQDFKRKSHTIEIIKMITSEETRDKGIKTL